MYSFLPRGKLGVSVKVWESYITENYYPNKFNGEITNIYKDGFGVKVENGEIVFTVVQPEGKPKMKSSDFVNGLLNKGNVIGKILEQVLYGGK